VVRARQPGAERQRGQPEPGAAPSGRRGGSKGALQKGGRFRQPPGTGETQCFGH
jgi:hypothetical protein